MNFWKRFPKKTSAKPTVLVKVVRCSSPEYWYQGAVGKIFEVEAQPFQGFYIVYRENLADMAFIKLEDCEVTQPCQ